MPDPLSPDALAVIRERVEHAAKRGTGILSIALDRMLQAEADRAALLAEVDRLQELLVLEVRYRAELAARIPRQNRGSLDTSFVPLVESRWSL